MGSVNELIGWHPCDRCGQRSKEAWHRREGSLILTFCRHHGLKYQYDLAAQGWLLIMTARDEVAA